MLLLHKKGGPLKLLNNPKSTFLRIWSMFGGVSNLLPISADYSLKSQIGIGKNWVGPPPRFTPARGVSPERVNCYNNKKRGPTIFKGGLWTSKRAYNVKSSDGLRTSMGPMYFNAYIYYVLQRGP